MMYSDALEHHGIRGMHWGVKHLNAAKSSVDASANIAKETKNIHNSVSNAHAISKIKDTKSLTDNQLKEKVNRMNLEQQYANLSANQLSKGRNYANSILEVTGSTLAIASSALGIALAMKQLKDKG